MGGQGDSQAAVAIAALQTRLAELEEKIRKLKEEVGEVKQMSKIIYQG